MGVEVLLIGTQRRKWKSWGAHLLPTYSHRTSIKRITLCQQINLGGSTGPRLIGWRQNHTPDHPQYYHPNSCHVFSKVPTMTQCRSNEINSNYNLRQFEYVKEVVKWYCVLIREWMDGSGRQPHRHKTDCPTVRSEETLSVRHINNKVVKTHSSGAWI